MSPQRVLLIQNDRTLATCYGEKLAAVGFAVEVASDGESALRRLGGDPVDVVALDLVLPTMEATEVIRTIRQLDALKKLPVITLACSLPALRKSAQQAGATLVLKREEDALVQVVDAVAEAAGLGKIAARNVIHCDEAWSERLRGEAPAMLAALRRDLHSLVHDQGGRMALRELLQHTHHLTETAVLLKDPTLTPISAALEGLALDLFRMPEQLNPSILRTLGQTADFIAHVLDNPSEETVRPLDATRILIVEDEPEAGQLIESAMQFVGLRASWVDAPATSLEMLAREIFDLIFLDVGLPQMTGFDLCAKIRTIEQHEKTPIVFLTGMATFQNRVQSSLSGGNDFIGKPFNIPELGVKALLWVFKGRMEQ